MYPQNLTCSPILCAVPVGSVGSQSSIVLRNIPRELGLGPRHSRLSRLRLGGARLVLYGGLLHKELMLTRMFEEGLTLVEQWSSTCEL